MCCVNWRFRRLVQYSIDRSQYIEERKALPVDDILLIKSR